MPPSSRPLTHKVAHLRVAVLLRHLVQRPELLEVELLQGQRQLKGIQRVACSGTAVQGGTDMQCVKQHMCV